MGPNSPAERRAQAKDSSRRRAVIVFVAGFAATLALLLVGSTVLGDRGLIRHRKLRAELDAVSRLNLDLQQQNARLRIETEALRSDPAYIESVARDELGWVGDDEVVILFGDEERH
ncbi:MAG: septum formation initiator family protein [Deltaproteobacteria bacterium]|nr:septum formation initiator family protein [Deltaproteobacteria bacterium]